MICYICLTISAAQTFAFDICKRSGPSVVASIVVDGQAVETKFMTDGVKLTVCKGVYFDESTIRPFIFSDLTCTGTCNISNVSNTIDTDTGQDDDSALSNVSQLEELGTIRIKILRGNKIGEKVCRPRTLVMGNDPVHETAKKSWLA